MALRKGRLRRRLAAPIGKRLSRRSSYRGFWRRRSNRPPRPRLRLTLVGLAVTACFGSLMVRLYYLQVLQPGASQPVVNSVAIRTVFDPAPRGLITARGGQLLASNRTVFEITLDRQVGSTNSAVVARVAALLGQTVKEVHGELGNDQISPFQPVPLAIDVPISTVIKVREEQSSLPGVRVELVPERFYPKGTAAAQLLGYLNRISATQMGQKQFKGYQPTDLVGDSGIEESYEHWLRGTEGQTSLYVNAAGDVQGTAGQTAPLQGDTVVLNLDLSLQQAAQNYLAQDIKSLEGSYDPTNHQLIPDQLSGSVVVLDPNNGAVLAMASYPSYNANVWDGGISDANYSQLTKPSDDEPLLNRAIDGLYPPGSTFKLATATAALEDGLLTPESTINDGTGSYVIPNCTGDCTYHDDTLMTPGPIDVSYALAASDDVFFYTLGVDFYEADYSKGEPHATPIQDVAEGYGLGEPTGVDLPGEETGWIDSYRVRQLLYQQYPKDYNPPSWWAGDNLEMAFGQGETLITPLQLAVAYSTFANGGTRYVPEVGAAIESPSGKLIERIAPKVSGHVDISAADRTALLDGFEGAVDQSYGTAYPTFTGFPLSQMQVAGKTGTGSVNGPGGQPQEPDSWFVGFAPATNPSYVVVASIENGGYGAAASAVVVRNVLAYLLHNPVPALDLPKP